MFVRTFFFHLFSFFSFSFYQFWNEVNILLRKYIGRESSLFFWHRSLLYVFKMTDCVRDVEGKSQSQTQYKRLTCKHWNESKMKIWKIHFKTFHRHTMVNCKDVQLFAVMVESTLNKPQQGSDVAVRWDTCSFWVSLSTLCTSWDVTGSENHNGFLSLSSQGSICSHVRYHYSRSSHFLWAQMASLLFYMKSEAGAGGRDSRCAPWRMLMSGEALRSGPSALFG